MIRACAKAYPHGFLLRKAHFFRGIVWELDTPWASHSTDSSFIFETLRGKLFFLVTENLENLGFMVLIAIVNGVNIYQLTTGGCHHSLWVVKSPTPHGSPFSVTPFDAPGALEPWGMAQGFGGLRGGLCQADEQLSWTSERRMQVRRCFLEW